MSKFGLLSNLEEDAVSPKTKFQLFEAELGFEKVEVLVPFERVEEFVAEADRSHPQHVNPNTRLNLNIFRRESVEDDVVDVQTLEQPFVQVTVELLGTTKSQTLERISSIPPLITVYGLAFSDPSDPTINISDVKFRTLE